MEFKEMLRKISFPLKQRKNEDEDIREEENHISEVQTNVYNLLLFFQFSEKSTLFIPLGFERKEEEEVEEMEYGEYSMDEYINQ